MMMSYVPAGHFAITPGASALPYVAYGIRCMDAGDITYRDSLGTTWTDTVAAGTGTDTVAGTKGTDTTTGDGTAMGDTTKALAVCNYQ